MATLLDGDAATLLDGDEAVLVEGDRITPGGRVLPAAAHPRLIDALTGEPVRRVA